MTPAVARTSSPHRRESQEEILLRKLLPSADCEIANNTPALARAPPPHCRESHEEILLRKLLPSMRLKVLRHRYGPMLSAVYLFEGCSKHFLSALLQEAHITIVMPKVGAASAAGAWGEGGGVPATG